MSIKYEGERAEIVTASKQIVDKLLAMNTHNRKYKASWVKKLCADIKNGRFYLTNQGVGVSKDGVLLDGQNRLMAIRDAGYPPVKFVLVTGLDKISQQKIDVGFRRTLSDLLALLIDKPSVANIKTAACNAIWILNRELCPGDDQVRAIAQFMDAYDDDINGVISALGSKDMTQFLVSMTTGNRA